MEIEKKYLVKTLPDNLDAYEMLDMKQAYLCGKPVVRVRSITHKDNTEYVLTVKGEGMVVREEHELSLDQDAFERLLAKHDGRILAKKRYLIPLDAKHTAELDVYFGDLSGLYTVEVEFEDSEDMRAFEVPEWFGEDVSEVAEYKNSYLCLCAEFGNNK